MADNPGTEQSSSPQLRQLRDALERAIASSLLLLDQLEAELTTVQTQEDIAQRKSRAAALIDVKKILEPLPLPQKPEVPLDSAIADAKVANFRRNIHSVILECQLKLRGMRHAVPKLSDISKGTSLARILSTLQKRLQGEKIDPGTLDRAVTTDHSSSISPGPGSPIPSPSPSPSPLSSSSTSAANSPPAAAVLSPSLGGTVTPDDLPLVLPGRKDSIVGRLSTPIPPSIAPSSPVLKQPRAVSLESERESASRLVHQGALQQAALQSPDPHPAIPKNPPTDSVPLTPADTSRSNPNQLSLSTGSIVPNPLAPSLGPGVMTPTPQNPPPVAPTPKAMLSLSLSNLAKLTCESPPHSPEAKPLPKPPAQPQPQSLPLVSPRITSKPLPVAPQTPRNNTPSAGPGAPPTPQASMPSSGPGTPSAGPGSSPQPSPRSMTHDPMHGSDVLATPPANDIRGRALSRSESGIARPNFAVVSERPESLRGADSPAFSELKNSRKAIVLKKGESAQIMPPTPRSRGKILLQEDVNIWDEGPDTPANFVTEKQQDGSTAITGGSFNKLVEKLTTPSTDSLDPQFSRIFFYTFQAWATPKQLLAKLLQRFAIPTREGMPTGEEATTIQAKTCAVMKRWIELLQQDFNSEDMQVAAASFTEEMKKARFAKEADEIVASLAEKTIRLTRKDSTVLNWDAIVKNASAPPPPPKCVLSTKVYADNILGFLNIDEEEIARQLSLMDHGNFSLIRPRELLGQAWARPEASTFAPNVLGHINHFNLVSQVCVHMIVHPETARDRARMVTKWIAVMRHLRTLNNFSSLMAIVAGLNNSAVLRLKKTLVEVPADSLKLYQEYESLMKSEANYRTYRDALRAVNPPCIPYLGVHVQDLTFMDENPDQLNGMVNFHKNRLIYSAISELLRCQQIGYNFTILMQMQASLRALATLDLNKLYQLSLQREPRDASKTGHSDSGASKGKTFGGVMAKVKHGVRKTTKDVLSELERNDPH